MIVNAGWIIAAYLIRVTGERQVLHQSRVQRQIAFGETEAVLSRQIVQITHHSTPVHSQRGGCPQGAVQTDNAQSLKVSNNGAKFESKRQ